MKSSQIEWTDNTFNPWWGCQKVSEGCQHCYAESLAKRWGHNLWSGDKRVFGDKHWSQPLIWDKDAGEKGIKVKVFCASMADVFDSQAPPHEREKLWRLIRTTHNLIWLMLTKRPENFGRFLPDDWEDGYKNVWLGVTCENQKNTTRLNILKDIPAYSRFVSAEPLIGPIKYDFSKFDWIIIGGESGPRCRPMDLNWAREIRNQTKQTKTALFLKQLGGHPNKRGHEKAILDGVYWKEFPS